MYISSKQVLFVTELTFFWMRHCSVYPGGLAFDLLAVERATLDHAVGPVLDAQEVQRRFRVVAPGPCGCGTEAQDRTSRHVDALAVHEELAPAPNDDVNLVIFLMLVEERHSLAWRDHVQRHLQARRPQEVPQEQLAPCWHRHIGRLQAEIRPSLHWAGVDTGEVHAPH